MEVRVKSHLCSQSERLILGATDSLHVAMKGKYFSLDNLMLKIAGESLVIAKDLAPKDTGNLAFNSIKLYLTVDGFKIVYRNIVAPYTRYLEEGTKFSKRHQGFINTKTRNAIMAHVHAVHTGKPTNLTDSIDRIRKNSADTPARQMRFLQSISAQRR